MCLILSFLLILSPAAIFGSRKFHVSATEAERDSLLQTFLRKEGVDSGRVALAITDLRTGRQQLAYRADKSMIPASIMKCLTAASILNDKGSDWRYETHVVANGPIKNDTLLFGNLTVVGSGDPTINARTSPASENIVAEIVAALQSRGIREIAGQIKVDDSMFAGPAVPASWAAGDLPHSYGTGSHAFNFENNSIGKSAVSNPALRFESAMKSALHRAGIAVRDSVMESTRKTDLMVHRSAALEDILRSCIMRSDNLYAESLLRTYGSGKAGDGSTAAAVAREARKWRQRELPMQDVTIVDGSGLSRSNRVTANFMSALLGEMSDSDSYVSLFPLAGKEGTLRNFLKDTPLDSYIALKTGSMSGIQCYAGYLLDDNFAPTHSVVVIANALPAGRGAFREALSSLLQNIFVAEDVL